jgi:hypothetical protein
MSTPALALVIYTLYTSGVSAVIGFPRMKEKPLSDKGSKFPSETIFNFWI